jgi:hypothetical protein
VSDDTATAILNLLAELRKIDAQLWESRVIWYQSLVDNLQDLYRKRGGGPPQKPEITNGQKVNETDISGAEIPLTDNFRRGNTENEQFPARKYNETDISGAEIPQSKVEESKVEYSIAAAARACAKQTYEPEKVNGKATADFAAYFAQRYPIPNSHWRDSLVELEQSYPMAWLMKATEEYLKAGATSIKYLEKILLRWQKTGGECPWEMGERQRVGPPVRAPTKYEVELERDRQRKIRAGLLPPDGSVIIDVIPES